MTKKILVIDDSALMRRVISDIINTDNRFNVIDTAINGLEALDKVKANYMNYDAIILDITMPKMNGIEFLRELNKLSIRVTIVVVSTLAKEGAKETIEALELGAFDFLTKPNNFFDVKSDDFKSRLINCLAVATKLENAAAKDIVSKPVKSETIDKSEKVITTVNNNPVKKNSIGDGKIVALACSTGGPKALQEVIPNLPANLDAPVFVVQHMPYGFTGSLAVRLDEMSNLKVKEAEDGDIVEKGVVYLAMGGHQMRVVSDVKKGYRLSITKEEARNGLQPCADILYESCIESSFEEITCVVLTGMGGDGTQGIKKLKDKKNVYVIAQDEKTSTVYGMPKVITEAGIVNDVEPLNKIYEAIVKNVGVH